MPHFDANLATTHDVVRHAIIPLSKVQARILGFFGFRGLGCRVWVAGLRPSISTAERKKHDSSPKNSDSNMNAIGLVWTSQKLHILF